MENIEKQFFMKKFLCKNEGFTLVEFSIVLVIVSISIATLLSLYIPYRQQMLVEKNANAITAMNEAIDTFFRIKRRWPCPAPLSAGPGDAGYGEEMVADPTDVDNMGMWESTVCQTGTDFKLAIRNIDLDGDGATEAVRIRTGVFPFRTIARVLENTNHPLMGRNDIKDAYGRQFTYVVTERQATNSYADHYGAIQIIDEDLNVIENNRDYLLISHGENGRGARSFEGIEQLPCPGTNHITVPSGTPLPDPPPPDIQSLARDLENCDDDGVFVNALLSLNEGSDFYDDTTAYALRIPFFLWIETPTPGDIRNINVGNVGIGVENPQAKLHVRNGNMYSYHNGDSTATPPIPAHGQTGTDNICDSTGNDCFPPELIGGNTFPECNNDEVMTGIANNTSTCIPAFSGNFTDNCPAGQYIYGFSYNAVTKILTRKCRIP